MAEDLLSRIDAAVDQHEKTPPWLAPPSPEWAGPGGWTDPETIPAPDMSTERVAREVEAGRSLRAGGSTWRPQAGPRTAAVVVDLSGFVEAMEAAIREAARFFRELAEVIADGPSRMAREGNRLDVDKARADVKRTEALLCRARGVEQPPTDPRERALWLRRNRNTGPVVKRRAPRHLEPGRRR